ncbi:MULTISPECIES: MBL fold metallo-hydrolase [unclassified Lentimicrobium]|uniref:MBL fold metallo-hydrolase n=1 Tax=unclassified Lentimicrobium TaxID=2677434 RepID=UPI00155372C1|nr:MULTISPECIES: MBL fold metallo-hydrolase [unclassified Lentimicrobium]NPD47349.1 MBL fold metallo-hydrolase [Lentimicrobium sp. S6]NPD85445.1 MBL fold metallo-hydrolase [Lentimicrobium sp. L6]
MRKILLVCGIIVIMATLKAQKSDRNPLDLNNNKISIVYLGHSGWAIKTKSNFLIFDYQEKYDFKWEKQPVKNLLSGYIDPDEIKDYNVFIFTSHEHGDHYDPLILDWDKKIENITYFFGWDFSSEEKYHCLRNPRSHYKDETIEVYTINSKHSGVFESAFLIIIDGIVIYHNGDYKGDYKNDYEYLKSKTEKIDIVFSNSDPWEKSQYILQAKYLMKQFAAQYFFPMHNINKENEYKKFAILIKDKEVQTEVYCAEIKGDKFILKIDKN